MKRYLALLVMSVLSGYYVLISQTWSVIYKFNLIFHPLVAAVAAAYFFFLVFQGRLPMPTGGVFGRAVVGGVIVTIIVGYFRSLFPHPLWDVLLVVSYPLWRIGVLRKDPEEFLTGCSVFFFSSVIASGAIFGIALGGRQFKNLLLLHRAASNAFVVALILSRVLIIRRTRGASIKAGGVGRAVSGSTVFGAITTLALISGITAFEISQSTAYPYYKFHLSTFSVERRGPHEQDVLPRDFHDVDLATKSYSCGGPVGCHQPILDDVNISVHGRSMHVEYFQKNVELLAEEIGENNQITCGGCHYPRMMFDRTKKLSDSYDELNYSCTFCHLIDEVFLYGDPRKTDLSVRLHPNHLQMFHHDGKDEITEFNRLLINLNPFGHSRVFTKDLYFKDEYCQVCHRLQIKPTPETPMNKPRCIDCHMQPRELLGLPGKEMNHIFPGTNTINPLLLGNDQLVEINKNYSSGRLPVPIKGWGSFWEPRGEEGDRQIWMLQKAMPLTDPIPGEDFTLRIITINAAIDHKFPGGALDLIEAWQRIKVTDQLGNVLLDIGELDETYHIDPRAHTMGGYMMGEDGCLVTKNRVWQIKSKHIERAIDFHHSTEDDYTFPLPESSTEIEIESYWMFRKMNQEFMDWVYGPAKVTVPPIVASEMKTTMALR